MRVLALLSGGKDSVCAIETVRGFGWEVVAALALHPAEDDAWMFHTPNLPVVRGVAQCLGVPLLEAPVRAGAEEEVEDLESAVRQAHAAFQLDGIVSGAIASEYQRTRIEAVAHRLGLKSFTPLWHKDAAHYLRTLLAGGWDVRFSRTAAEGVPNAWAGAPLDAARMEAMRHHPARPHVAGEGGEYETLVLDAPCYRSRLVVDAAETFATASRATWNVQRWHLEPKHA
jgi:ABC transporter with metal-binding/Fe-S-binding domain ATP-binding protein